MVVYYPQMNTSGASKVLPIILTAITLATAVFFYNQRQVLRQKTQELLSKSTKPTPTLTPTVTPTPTISPTVTPKTNGTNEPNLTNKTNLQTTKTVASITTVCTPVYGMANTCAEHAVVDTALDTSIFYNLAGMSYIFGLAAFIKSKRI